MFDSVDNTGALSLLGVVVGNTNTRVGVFQGKELLSSSRAPNSSIDEIAALIRGGQGQLSGEQTAIVVASDNDPVLDAVLTAVRGSLEAEVYRFGQDLEVPIERALLPDATPGRDRLLNALAAFDLMQQACCVIDTGTAITVDFVDGEGVFQGGAIAPGASMMLHAMHEGAEALPQLELQRVPDNAFGKNTAESMMLGTHFAVRGMVRALVERFAIAYDAFPPVVATGTDAPLLLEDDEIVDRIVPDLTLRGIEVACRRLLDHDSDG